MSTSEILELMPAMYVASAAFGLVFRLIVGFFRWVTRMIG